VSATDFEEFAAAYAARALKTAFVLTGNPHDAWDLSQETLGRVAERWRRIDNPEAYANTVMTRLNIDRIRRIRREVITADVPDAVVDTTFELDTLPDWFVSGLQSLTPRQRTALALRCIEDLDLAGIAERMQCSVGTVKSHLSRAAERMRNHAELSPPNETSLKR